MLLYSEGERLWLRDLVENVKRQKESVVRQNWLSPRDQLLSSFILDVPSSPLVCPPLRLKNVLLHFI